MKDKDRELAEELLEKRRKCNRKLLVNKKNKQELRLDFQQLKLDKEAQFAKMLEEHREQWEQKYREETERWERKSQEEKKEREKIEQKAREDRARWELQSLEDRRALAERDEQYCNQMRVYRKKMTGVEGRADDKSDKKQIDRRTTGPDIRPRRAAGALGIIAILAGVATFNPALVVAGAGVTASTLAME